MDSLNVGVAEKESHVSPARELRVMIARQPIYNNRMGIFGYELLFRSAKMELSGLSDDQATSQVLNSALMDFDFKELVCGRNAVINITRLFAEEIVNYPLVPQNTVLDFPDDIEFDDQLIENVMRLRRRGYKISLGGFKLLRRASKILPMADIYRVNVRQLSPDILDKFVDRLKVFRNLSLLALKVETVDEYKRYSNAGFHYLQGYFLSRPRVFETRELPTNRLAVLNLLAKINDESATLKELERIISSDVAMSFKLLKLVNSSFFGFVHEVRSIQHAVVLLGRDEIKRLVSVFTLSQTADQPIAMIEFAFMRAKLCELIAERAGKKSPGYYTVGMFSALDILMQQPMAELIKKLPFSPEISSAILNHSGHMGRMLSLVKSIELGRYEPSLNPDIEESWVNDSYLKAVRWTHELMQSFD